MSLDNFGKKLSIGILVICALLFAVSVLVRGENVMNAFLFAVALAVAAIPEALSSIVTIVLSFGTQKMAREHAIIRKLQAVEGLGSVSVICSDKTGTLTQNKMTVRQLYVGGRVIPRRPGGLQGPHPGTPPPGGPAVQRRHRERARGDRRPHRDRPGPAGEDFGFDELDVREHWPRLGAPFDSDRKLMSTLHQFSGGYMLMTKGAVDVLLDRTLLGPGGGRRLSGSTSPSPSRASGCWPSPAAGWRPWSLPGGREQPPLPGPHRHDGPPSGGVQAGRGRMYCRRHPAW